MTIQKIKQALEDIVQFMPDFYSPDIESLKGMGEQALQLLDQMQKEDLASRGLIRGAVAEIEGLDEAIKWEMTYIPINNHDQDMLDVLQQAARAYAALSMKDGGIL